MYQGHFLGIELILVLLDSGLAVCKSISFFIAVLEILLQSIWSDLKAI